MMVIDSALETSGIEGLLYSGLWEVAAGGWVPRPRARQQKDVT